MTDHTEALKLADEVLDSSVNAMACTPLPTANAAYTLARAVKSLEAGAALYRNALHELALAYTFSERHASGNAKTEAAWKLAGDAMQTTSAGSAMVEEIERLRKNQRTKGTVEVCANCKSTVDSRDAINCDLSYCPLRHSQGEPT